MTEREIDLFRALRKAFPGRPEFEELLAYIDKSLDGIIGTMGLDLGVPRVLRTAKTQGWLAELEAAALELNPGSPELTAWYQKHCAAKDPGQSAAAGASADWQQLDPRYFDLKAIRAAIWQAVTAGTGQVLGFGVRYWELKFVEKLEDVVKGHLEGDTQSKSPLNLSPEYEKLSPKLDRMRDYTRDLDSKNVCCVVFVDTTPANHFAHFWTQVIKEHGGRARHLVLLFVGNEETAFPAGVTELPQPVFDRDDLTMWAMNTVMIAKWPVALAAAWTELLCADADYGARLDIGRVYEAMDESIADIRFDAQAFRKKLENRMSR